MASNLEKGIQRNRGLAQEVFNVRKQEDENTENNGLEEGNAGGVNDSDVSRYSEIKHNKDLKEKAYRGSVTTSVDKFIDDIYLQRNGFPKEDIDKLSKKEKRRLVDSISVEKFDYSLSALGWDNLTLNKFLISEEEKKFIQNNSIPVSSWTKEVSAMKGLGYSLNQIFYVIPKQEREEIFNKNISPNEWLAESRKKYSKEKESVSPEAPNADKSEPTIKEDKSAETLEIPEEKEVKISSSENISRRKYLEDNIKILEHELLLISKDLDRAVEGGEKSKVERLKESYGLKDNELREFKKALRRLLAEDNGSTNRIDQSKFAQAVRGAEVNTAVPVEGVVNYQGQELKKDDQESQEGGEKLLSLFELGYSQKEVADMDPEERIEIYKNQIRRGGEESASPSQSEILEKKSGENKKQYSLKHRYVDPDGVLKKVKFHGDEEDVKRFLNDGTVPNVSGAPSSGGVENVLTQRRIEETEVLKEIISDDVYERFIDENIVPEYILTEIAYLIIERKRELTEREKAIFAGKTSEINKIIEKIKPEEGDNSPISQDAAVFEKNGPGKPGENLTGKLGESAYAPSEGADEKVGDVDLSQRIAQGVLKEESSHEGKQAVPISTTTGSVNKEDIQKLIEQKQQRRQSLDSFEKNKETLEKNGWDFESYANLTEAEQQYAFWHNLRPEDLNQNEKKSAEENSNVLEQSSKEENEKVYQSSESKDQEVVPEKSVSAGAKEFLKNERASAEKEREVDEQIGNKLSEFNISLEQMRSISPDFFSLSTEKQRYLISKLEQKIYLDADLNSKIQTEEEIQKKKGFLGLKKIIPNLKKGWTQVNKRDSLIKESKISAGENYKEEISILSAQLYGMPELKYVLNPKTGKLEAEFQYFEVDENNKESKNYWNKKYFNQAASRFGEIPKEWSSDRASKRERKIYEKAEEDLERRKNLLLDSLVENGRRENKAETEEDRIKREEEILFNVNSAEGFARFNSSITQNPEITSWSKDFFEKVAGGNVTKRAQALGFVGFGAIGKKLSRSSEIAGATLTEAAQQQMFYAGLGFSVLLGGYLGFKKKGKEYKEKEYRQQFGIDAMGGAGLLEGVKNSFEKNKYQKESYGKDKGVKKFGDAKYSYERINKEIEKIESETNEAKKQKLLESLRNRVFVVQEMEDENRMNYGNLKQEMKNRQALFSSISKAEKTMLLNGFYDRDENGEIYSEQQKLFDRFTGYIGDREADKYKLNRKIESAVVGGLVGSAGYYLGGLVSEKISEYGIQEKVSKAFDTLSNPAKMGYKLSSALGINENNVQEVLSNNSSEALANSNTLAEGASETVTNSATELAKDSAPIETVMAGSRGFIGAIDDLQDKLKLRFGANMPAQYQEFMSKNPHVLAKEWGVYNPGEVNESAVIMKGEGLSIDSKGVVRFVGLNGTDEMYVPKGVEGVSPVESERRFFDSGNTAKVEVNPLAEKNPSYRGPAQVNEGYVRTRLEAPTEEPKSWYEKPVPTEFGASPVRGEYRFLNSPDGKIVGIDTSKMISDEVLKFRKNPAAFLNKDLSGTTLLAKTDSFAVKTLRDNSKLIEEFLAKKNLLDAPAGNLTADQTTFLKNDVYRLGRDASIRTNGAFDSGYKPSMIERMGGKPTTYFSTDNQVEPRINPSTVSTEEAPSVAKEPKPADLTEGNNAREPLQKSVKVESLNAEQKTYSFNTENIKGKIRFLYNEKGEIVEIQNSQSTSIGGVNNAEKMLKDDWMSKAGQYSKDEAVGIKKIKTNIKTLKEYMTILEDSGFKPNSLEYKYLNGRINLLKEEYKDILK